MAESREKTVRESGGAARPALTRDSRYPSSQSSPQTKGTSQTRERSGNREEASEQVQERSKKPLDYQLRIEHPPLGHER
jgi:hypothetical protein